MSAGNHLADNHEDRGFQTESGAPLCSPANLSPIPPTEGPSTSDTLTTPPQSSPPIPPTEGPSTSDTSTTPPQATSPTPPTVVSSTSVDSKVTRKLVAYTPRTLVMDCGAWTNGLMTVGLMSGSTVAIAKLVPNRSHDNSQKPTNNTTINHFFSNWPGSVMEVETQLQCIRSEVVVPYCDDDVPKIDRLLCEPDQLYVFVPDTHVGIGDTADDFRRNPKDVDVEDFNFLALLTLLTHARKSCANTIITQLGDMIDVWETEALIRYDAAVLTQPTPTHWESIYYTQVPSVEVNRPIEIQCRGRLERAKMAIDMLRNTNSHRLSQLTEQIDYLVHGNHDDELRLEPAYLTQAPLKPRQGFGSILVDGQIQSKWSEPNEPRAWRAEHGHEFDAENATAKINRVEDLHQLVQGKGITFLWARLERNERLLPKNEKMAECLAAADHPESRFFSKDYLWLNGSAPGHCVAPNEISPSTPAWLPPNPKPSLPLGVPEMLAYDSPDGIEHTLVRKLTLGSGIKSLGAWVGEWYHFDLMRAKLRSKMYDWTRKLNPGWEEVPGAGGHLILAPQKGVTGPLKPALRVLIHAHTHDPQIERIHLGRLQR